MNIQQHRIVLAQHIGIAPERLVLRFRPTEVGIVDATPEEVERLRSAIFRYWDDLGLQTEQEEQEVERAWAGARLITP